MRLLIALLPLLAACASAGAPPALLPHDEILHAVPPTTENPADSLARRGEALRARAAALRAATP